MEEDLNRGLYRVPFRRILLGEYWEKYIVKKCPIEQKS
jgi:hypothetical protein